MLRLIRYDFDLALDQTPILPELTISVRLSGDFNLASAVSANGEAAASLERVEDVHRLSLRNLSVFTCVELAPACSIGTAPEAWYRELLLAESTVVDDFGERFAGLRGMGTRAIGALVLITNRHGGPHQPFFGNTKERLGGGPPFAVEPADARAEAMCLRRELQPLAEHSFVERLLLHHVCMPIHHQHDS